MLRSIMVEMGDSPHAAAALETALWLAKAFKARLHALTCLDERTAHSQEVRRMLEEHVREDQDALVKRCRDEGVECICDLELGDRREALVVLSRKADLLVVGDASTDETQAGIFSSAATSVAREVVRDVLFVGDKAPAFRSIVVGYAGQENSCNALRLVAHIAEKSKGTIHIVTSDYDIGRAAMLMTVAEDYLEPFKVELVRHEASDEPAVAILDTMAEADADLVALGAYRKGKLHHLVFGDTATSVLEGSLAPVLICR